ncbi:MAG: cell division protein ZapA [Alteraurantiacibacter sp.]
MSNVTLDIAGRKYTIACAEGEEPHIEMLGASISEKLSQIDNIVGQSPERILLYASLLLADELHEKNSASPAPVPDANTASHLESLAERMEALAMQIETA